MTNERVRPDFSHAAKVFAQEYTKNNPPKPTGMESFGWLVVELAIVIAAGGVMCVGYNWLVPEIYTSLPNINVGEALGLRVLTMFGTGNVRFTPSTPDTDRSTDTWKQIAILCMCTLFFFIAKQFV